MMKQRVGSLILVSCAFLTLWSVSGAIATAAGGETVGLSPLFTTGTTMADYDITDGSGATLAHGFVAGQVYTLTVNMTAASMTAPRVVIIIPPGYVLDDYTRADNAILAPYMSANGVTQTLESDGRRTLAYWFKNKASAVGFTVHRNCGS